MAVIVYGFNRRQKPLELRCPGGKVVISRAPRGTVRVQFVADSGVVEVAESASRWSREVSLVHEEREEA